MSKVEEILEKLNNWHTNDYTTVKQPELTYIEAVEAINKLLIEARLDEHNKFALALTHNLNLKEWSLHRQEELLQSLKDKEE